MTKRTWHGWLAIAFGAGCTPRDAGVSPMLDAGATSTTDTAGGLTPERDTGATASSRPSGRCKTNADCGPGAHCDMSGGSRGMMMASSCPSAGCGKGFVCRQSGASMGMCIATCPAAGCPHDEHCANDVCVSDFGACDTDGPGPP